MENTFKVLLEGDLIIVKLLKASDTKEEMHAQVDGIGAELENILKGVSKKKFNVLVDISGIKQSVWVDTDATKKYTELSKKSEFNNIAVVLDDPILKGVASFIVRVLKNTKKIKLFSKKEEALEWLKK